MQLLIGTASSAMARRKGVFIIKFIIIIKAYTFQTRQKEGRAGLYMLRNFGKVYNAVSTTKSATDFQVTFVAERVRRSLITIRMEADSLRVVINKYVIVLLYSLTNGYLYRSPGRIVEAYIEAFEALSSDGLLQIIVQNTGSLSATYKVFVAHCSAGVDYIPEKSVTIDPGEETNVTFIVHSFHSIGKINTCDGSFLIMWFLTD